ncbi:MAG: acetate--CoA ligase family protein [Pseudomonadota bacterium]
MLNKEIIAILNRSLEHGWVMEPEAKRLFQLAGLPVPRFVWARDFPGAMEGAAEIGYPLAAKIVSPTVIHKSEVQGVAVGIGDDEALRAFYDRMSGLPDFAGILIEEMATGHELIVGAKADYQFGLVILMGIGGTAVEVYGDVAIRMAPLTGEDALSMLDELKGGKLLAGYRGKPGINREKLMEFMVGFSGLLEEISSFVESVDLNPLLCSEQGCVIADARIMLGAKFRPDEKMIQGHE